MKPLEKRSYSFEVRAENSERGAVIVGRPIIYNSRTNIGGMFDEIIEPGALNNTDLTDVRFLVNHDTSKIPLARSRRNNGNSTMQLAVDNEGMTIRVFLDTENNAEASALYSAVQRGDISGMSFMFGVPDGGDEWEGLGEAMPLRHVRSISSVVEVSAVTFPAYDATEIYARSKETLDNARSALEKAQQQANSEADVRSEDNTELVLLKEKTKFLVRFNPNHDGAGKFAPKGGGGGGGGSSSGSGSGSGSESGGATTAANKKAVDSTIKSITKSKNYTYAQSQKDGEKIENNTNTGDKLVFTNKSGKSLPYEKTGKNEWTNKDGDKHTSDGLARVVSGFTVLGGSWELVTKK